MKIKQTLFSIFAVFILYINLNAQVSPGAKQVALSHSGIAQANDVFSLFNNPAGLAQLNWRELGIYYSPSPFGESKLSNAYASYLEPFTFGNITVGYMQYGFELYKENKIALSFSRRFTDDFFLGATVLYQNLSIEKYGSDNSFVFNLGGLHYLDDYLRLGVALHNLSRATYGAEDDQIPFILSAGISYDFNSDLTFNGAIEKELDFEPSFRFGVDYDLIEYLSIRAGFMNEPSSYSVGVGIHYSFLNLDYAFFTHPVLDLTHQVGLLIDFETSGSRKAKIKNYLFSL